jgi:adenosylcobinamide-GDP ribazoletransferase
MRHFIAAIQFITIIPVGKADTFDPPRMIPYFPVVGLLLGILTAVFDQFATALWSRPVASLLDVLFLAVLTGAFHLDGLGDSADGLLGQRPKEKALTIMKDSRLGTMGLVAIVFGLALKWAGIAGLDADRTLLLIIVPAYARAGMLFGMRFLEYGRPEGGTGLDFFKSKLQWSAFWGLAAPVVLSLFLGWAFIWLNLAFVAFTAILVWYFKRRIGCVTGDMLGAMAEILESGLFLLISIGGVV